MGNFKREREPPLLSFAACSSAKISNGVTPKYLNWSRRYLVQYGNY